MHNFGCALGFIIFFGTFGYMMLDQTFAIRQVLGGTAIAFGVGLGVSILGNWLENG